MLQLMSSFTAPWATIHCWYTTCWQYPLFFLRSKRLHHVEQEGVLEALQTSLTSQVLVILTARNGGMWASFHSKNNISILAHYCSSPPNMSLYLPGSFFLNCADGTWFLSDGPLQSCFRDEEDTDWTCWGGCCMLTYSSLATSQSGMVGASAWWLLSHKSSHLFSPYKCLQMQFDSRLHCEDFSTL